MTQRIGWLRSFLRPSHACSLQSSATAAQTNYRSSARNLVGGVYCDNLWEYMTVGEEREIVIFKRLWYWNGVLLSKTNNKDFHVKNERQTVLSNLLGLSTKFNMCKDCAAIFIALTYYLCFFLCSVFAAYFDGEVKKGKQELP